MEERESPIFGSPPPPPLGAGADVAGGGGIVVSGGDPSARKKRGRPRKYDADGNLNPSYKSPPPAEAAPPPPPGYHFSGPAVKVLGSKRGRGKPAAAGAASWQFSPCLGELLANTAGRDLTPHVLTVHTGEDVVAKIMSFSQQAPRGVCVLSANGSVSNVTIRQPGSSGGLLTYEGRFEILSLNGSFTVSENGGMKSRMGGLSVSLASVDGRVIGGGLAGLLMAASPIQMVVASFVQDGFTHAQKRKKYYEPRTTPLTSASEDTAIPATPVSEAAPNINIYPVPASQVRMQSYEAHNIEVQNNETHYNKANNSEDDKYMSDKQNPHTSSDSGEWNISDLNSTQRSYPDINVSLLVD